MDADDTLKLCGHRSEEPLRIVYEMIKIPLAEDEAQAFEALHAMIHHEKQLDAMVEEAVILLQAGTKAYAGASREDIIERLKNPKRKAAE